MDGVDWEVKCPRGKGKRTIDNCVRKAMKQSPNLIINLRHLKSSETKAVDQLKRDFNSKPKIKKLIVIKKNGDDLIFDK